MWFGVGRGRVSVAIVGVIVASLAWAGPAEAKRKIVRKGGGYNPPTAAMVVDAKTGKVLFAENADANRHPASITKVMTLYMLFEQLEKGRYSLNSPLKVSAWAARQAPSKLSLQAGETIEVEDAIKALVTKSANDVAVVVAENIGGTEQNFAAMMTRKARSIGMSRTTFRNASGLPDPGQITTARDLITMGRAIQDRFPKYYGFFATRSFSYDGAFHGNHNKLLGRIEGVDGIKTGYTRMSGFNLLTSVKADGRQLIAVVLGGRSGASRDRYMAELIDRHLDRAYAGNRTVPAIVESQDTAAAADEDQAPAPRTTAALQPKQPVPTPVAAAPAPAQAKAIAPAPVRVAATIPVAPTTTPQAKANAATTTTPGGWKVGAQPVVRTASIAPKQPPVPPGWSVQIGTAKTETAAKSILSEARSDAAKVLKGAVPNVERASEKAYRARFAGFKTKDAAEKACKSLKKSGYDCFVKQI
jgi:D-alanyl-D-alanine carboxypeptidase